MFGSHVSYYCVTALRGLSRAFGQLCGSKSINHI